MYVKYTGWSFILDQVQSDMLEITRIFSEVFYFITDFCKTSLVNPQNYYSETHNTGLERQILIYYNDNNEKIRKIRQLF